MGSQELPFDSESPPVDDREVADRYRWALRTYSSDGTFDQLPKWVETELEEWSNQYLNRREAEVGVSPISPYIREAYLDVSYWEWTQRVSESERDIRESVFAEESTEHVTVKVPDRHHVREAIDRMEKFGWKTSRVDVVEDEHTAEIQFVPVLVDFEVVRRLMIAGLTPTEAIAFWGSDLFDNRPDGRCVNPYLSEGTDEIAILDRLADAMEIASEAVEASRSAAENKLVEIDPTLPDFLRERRGGRPLPDEMWSEFELAQLYR